MPATAQTASPPFHPKDYPPKDYAALLELLGQEEFERRVCPLDVARERWRERRELARRYGRRPRESVHWPVGT